MNQLHQQKMVSMTVVVVVVVDRYFDKIVPRQFDGIFKKKKKKLLY